MNIQAVIGIVISALSLALTFSSIHAQTAGEILKAYESLKKPERKTRLIEGAKKEGRLVFYGTLGVDASRPCWKNFAKAIPTFRSITIARARSAFTTAWLTRRERGNTRSISSSSQRVLSPTLFALALSIPTGLQKRRQFVPNSSIHGISGALIMIS